MDINVTRSSMPGFDEYCNEIKELWDSRWLTNMGKKHRELQKMLKDYLGVRYVDLFCNGHMAIELSLNALNIKGEVITTPFTFASTTHAIVRNGLTPVFCDINRNDYTIDSSKIEELITDKTCAIMPVHVYGNICDVQTIRGLAEKYNLKVIYDAAHTFGEKYNGKGIGTYGDVSCFSFHATKVYHTIEGGAACFNDEQLCEKIFEIKDFGIHDAETVNIIGANAKMSEFSAAMGICNLRHVDEEIRKREAIYNQYLSNLDGIEGIKLNRVQKGVSSNYSYFPVVFEKEIIGVDRDEIMRRLAQSGIGSRKYFYPLITEFGCYKDTYSLMNTPVACDISRKVLTLPMFADLSIDTVDFICEIIRRAIGKK